MMKIYHYHRKTGELLSEVEARRDPLEPRRHLLPACATTIKPIEVASDERPCFINGEWVAVKDRRNTDIFRKDNGEKRKGFLSNDELSKAYTLAPKPKGDYVFNRAKNNWEEVEDEASAYASIAEQLDMQYHDAVEGTTTWIDHVTAVKVARRNRD